MRVQDNPARGRTYTYTSNLSIIPKPKLHAKLEATPVVRSIQVPTTLPHDAQIALFSSTIPRTASRVAPFKNVSFSNRSYFESSWDSYHILIMDQPRRPPPLCTAAPTSVHGNMCLRFQAWKRTWGTEWKVQFGI